MRGRYTFPNVKAAMDKRLRSLTHPRWIDAVTTLIYKSKDRHFRWHDSGDLQSIEHLRNIIRVCKNLPRVKFWLPTREYQTVEAYRRMGGRIPPNLCIRYSAHLVDAAPPIQYGLPTSTVVSIASSDSEDTHVCPAPRQNMKCGTCRACWNRSVKVVSYKLKWVKLASREVTK
jgi:Gene product 88